jgi:hypothetical protein
VVYALWASPQHITNTRGNMKKLIPEKILASIPEGHLQYLCRLYAEGNGTVALTKFSTFSENHQALIISELEAPDGECTSDVYKYFLKSKEFNSFMGSLYLVHWLTDDCSYYYD